MDFRILGRRFEARTDDGDMLQLSRPQVRQLLSLLALEEGQAVTATTLILHMWDEDGANLVGSLKQIVYMARQDLPPGRLLTELNGYRLRLDADDRLDLTEFRRLVEHGRATRDSAPAEAIVAYQRAIDLGGDEPPGDLPESTSFKVVRRTLMSELRSAREELAEVHLARGHHRQMIARLRRWLAEDPLNEHLRGLLMLALYRAGRADEALQEYEAAVAAWGDGLQPGPWLQQLRDQICRNDPALTRPKPWELPESERLPGNVVDTKTPSSARIYDYFLGGKDNYAADRAAAEEILRSIPESSAAARANRGFLTRAVRFLVREAGISQFLDIGAGLPTQGNVHEIAQGEAAEARVVYVDNDPVVLAHGRALLETNPRVAVLHGDLRCPEEILADARLRELIDFSEPLGLLLVGVLHFVGDGDQPYEHVRHLIDVLAPGSHAVISHGYKGGLKPEVNEAAQRVYRRSTLAIHSRDPGEVAEFFRGLDVLPPGIVWVTEWRPNPADHLPDPTHARFIGGVARRP
ncbi:SAM-dependent methyltransferase [Actinomadura rupiterrae]|uniref:SAM-dependent methyltransferase n=1 Tax=Actinomadura rupiterrae TaxID=559627 RepID=UPI0020A26831|nr:SAM-dependent methyltransferase [Actinomadura rupiterrae]MCP2338903.1 DNA-binding SARP family transcriptional activator/SAM-dependent methyltransferase [Actinomadura rupiterrae]